jgi:murein L,D-transpeptidase YcbB/YkuD
MSACVRTFLALTVLVACRTTTEPTPHPDTSHVPPNAPTAVSAPAAHAEPDVAPQSTPERLDREALNTALASVDLPAFVSLAYKRSGGTPIFVRQGALTPAGETCLAVMNAAPKEAIEPENIGLGTLEKQRSAGIDMDLEVTIAATVGKWLIEQWPGNPATFTEEEKKQEPTAVAAQRASHYLAQILAIGPDDAGKTRTALHSHRPPLVQYERLIPVLARYQQLAASGGWNTEFAVIRRAHRARDAIRYRPKRRVPGKLIPATKKRLHAEGFYALDDDEDAWNDELQAAILAYRASHQHWPKVWIDYEMRQSMKLPVEFRVIQIKLALERMRRSRIGDDRYYVHVVVPEYHAEVWEDGERKMRFRVIVGGRQRYRDKKTREWRFPNATPLFSDQLERVVLNPYWTVPARLRKDIRRQQEKDPEHYEKNGYEEIPLGGGGMTIRQKPGKANALGRVKFLFPNSHDVYMHDTPRKDLFRPPVRAFSHGCLRVQDPLEFAWFLLSHEGRDDLTERRIRRNAFGGGQFNYTLSSGPTIHIEYWTVRVDDEGTVHWLEDIYLHDAREARDRFGLDLGNLK